MNSNATPCDTESVSPDLRFFDRIVRSSLVDDLLASLPDSGNCMEIRGANASSKGLLLAAMFKRLDRQFIVITADSRSGLAMWNDMSVVLDDENTLYIGERVTTQKSLYDDADGVAENVHALRYLTERPRRALICDIDTVLTKFPAVQSIREQTLHLTPGTDLQREALIRKLAFGGFERVDFVAATGEYAVRGGIVDVFPVGFGNPLRIEFFGDIIESIREFDRMNQRSIRALSETSFVASLFLDEDASTHNRMHAFFAPDAVLVFDGIEMIMQRCLDECEHTIKELREKHSTIIIAAVEQQCTSRVDVKAESQPSMNGSVVQFVDTLRNLRDRGIECILLADSKAQADRLEDLLHGVADDDYPASAIGGICCCPLAEGFILPSLQLALLTEHQIFNRRPAQKRASTSTRGLSLREMKQLRVGDYVVHSDKGIGRFTGFETISVNGGIQETARLVYTDDDLLFVNLNYISKLQKYSSEEGRIPTLSKLGSAAWDRMKEKTKRRLKDIARDLIRLYAHRKLSSGFAFAPDGQWQKELEASFMYEDTPDQAKATDDVKRDMEESTPMDRLVCGDVGYGKTEVAVRAAFKAVVDGKQTAVLVPTTILAMQHYNTFRDRLSRYAVRVESLSRFKSRKEQQLLIEKLKSGAIDIIIGTHRLLSNDTGFKNLGLLIIDEEHRFGVAAKEKLRELRKNVDTLTMTATPIPRTLNFSLLGARDLSVMETPPKNRLPIITHILPFDRDVIVEGVQREMQRGGQTFFVNDKVIDLEHLVDMLRSYLPGVRIGIAHGRMRPTELEREMLRFIEKKYDVLVATKIIESGLDIPNANTIFINKAHNFGLAELYQLRGRVGRSNIQAYAYMLIPPKAKFTREALKRLQAIEEFSELGTGFHLALRDLEIRGAGNLLGAEQSGFIAEIGFDLYMSTLEEAVRELKHEEFSELFPDVGNDTRPRSDVLVELGLDSYLPHDYVNNATERFDIYKRMYNCDDDEHIDEMERELQDRFGPLPTEAQNLMFSIRVRLVASRIRFSRVTLENKRLDLAFPPEDDTIFYEKHFQSLMQWVVRNANRAKLDQSHRQVRLILAPIHSPEDARAILEEMRELLTVTEGTVHA